MRRDLLLRILSGEMVSMLRISRSTAAVLLANYCFF